MPEPKHPGLKYWLKNKIVWVLLLLGAAVAFPLPTYKPAQSTALYSRQGNLMSAVTSAEQQWCLPLENGVPERFKTALLLYEDAYFYWHPGVNPVSVGKAVYANWKAGRIRRGASTLTMQLMRMKYRHADRNLASKLIEILGAVKYTAIKSKSKVLQEWAEIAPFGGNTIGLRSASLRYFGIEPGNLSWGQAALLAVIPNLPGMVNPEKNRHLLLAKRNALLKKLHQHGHFNAEDLALYLDEDIPSERVPIPGKNYHFLQFLKQKQPDVPLFHSTVDETLQQALDQLIQTESAYLQVEGIQHMAAVILDVQSNEVLAYTGNVPGKNKTFQYVDLVQSPRSYGSLLKPLLYAEALESGHFLPNELIPDIPTHIGDFRPKNFDQKYRGAVTLDQMVVQSLNVPAVRVLQQLGIQPFYNRIKTLGLKGIDKGASHYGLSIILGGAETSLWELCRLYKGFARNYLGLKDPYQPVQAHLSHTPDHPKHPLEYSPYAIRHTVQYMSDLERPREEKGWTLLGNAQKIAWKTGTSFGHRDAWAIGFNDRYLVGIWVGNEDGEGRHNLTGIQRAAPVLFKAFHLLPETPGPKHPPYGKKENTLQVCGLSGKLAGPLCQKTTPMKTHSVSHKYETCQYHQVVYLNSSGQMMNESCPVKKGLLDTMFILPPEMGYYFKQHNAQYKELPGPDPDCPPYATPLKILYPQNRMKVFLPRENNEKKNQLIARVFQSTGNGRVYWYINDTFLEATHSGQEHKKSVSLSKGTYTLTVIDQNGNSDAVTFDVL
jgi:penicillin-binding protein 1C